MPRSGCSTLQGVNANLKRDSSEQATQKSEDLNLASSS